MFTSKKIEGTEAVEVCVDVCQSIQVGYQRVEVARVLDERQEIETDPLAKTHRTSEIMLLMIAISAVNVRIIRMLPNAHVDKNAYAVDRLFIAAGMANFEGVRKTC